MRADDIIKLKIDPVNPVNDEERELIKRLITENAGNADGNYVIGETYIVLPYAIKLQKHDLKKRINTKKRVVFDAIPEQGLTNKGTVKAIAACLKINEHQFLEIDKSRKRIIKFFDDQRLLQNEVAYADKNLKFRVFSQQKKSHIIMRQIPEICLVNMFGIPVENKILFLDVAIRLTLAVKKLHDQKIAHGDLKPDNFVIDFKLNDKGAISSIFNLTPIDHETCAPDGTQVVRKICTASYAPAEVLKERIHKNQLTRYMASDIYSLGAMYILLYGKYPRLQQDKSTQLALASQPLEFASSLGNEAYVKLCEQMVAVKMEERPTVNEVLSRVVSIKAKMVGIEFNEGLLSLLQDYYQVENAAALKDILTKLPDAHFAKYLNFLSLNLTSQTKKAALDEVDQIVQNFKQQQAELEAIQKKLIEIIKNYTQATILTYQKKSCKSFLFNYLDEVKTAIKTYKTCGMNVNKMMDLSARLTDGLKRMQAQLDKFTLKTMPENLDEFIYYIYFKQQAFEKSQQDAAAKVLTAVLRYIDDVLLSKDDISLERLKNIETILKIVEQPDFQDPLRAYLNAMETGVVGKIFNTITSLSFLKGEVAPGVSLLKTLIVAALQSSTSNRMTKR